MIPSEKRKELETIIRGKSITGREDNLSTARNYLSRSFETNTKAKETSKVSQPRLVFIEKVEEGLEDEAAGNMIAAEDVQEYFRKKWNTK